MKNFVKLYLYYAQKRLKNAINICVKQQNLKTLEFIRSSVKFTCIRLRSSLNKYKHFKMLDLVEAM